MPARALGLSLALVLAALWPISLARAQQASQSERPAISPGSGESLLGAGPGSSGEAGTSGLEQGQDVVGGRAGAGVPRVLQGTMQPDRRPDMEPGGIKLPRALPRADLPLYGTLGLPTEPQVEGPPDGLTLDKAIDQLLERNITLRALVLEIPKAQADVLTASLRSNPLLYADSQLIPYGSYSDARPGGPTQYDLNVTFPVDLTGKRRSRTAAACEARRVVEAQYQNAVRLELDNLYTAYVDVLAARETLRFAGAGVEGLRQMTDVARSMREKGETTGADVDRIAVQLDSAEIGVLEAEEGLHDAKQGIGLLIGLSDEQVETLELRGSLRVAIAARPDMRELIEIALRSRPDLAAFRLGVRRALANVDLAEANRLENVFLMVQPYTFQDNSVFDRKSAHSWAVGLTVPLPAFNRNQGNIERARLSVAQTQLQLEQIEREIVVEVERAAHIHDVAMASVARLERDTVPRARRTLDTARALYTTGEESLVLFLGALADYNSIVRQYRDALVRHRRSTLRLNTVVGQRLLP
jgi:cobalt-zinc-cadmium efflux system outer membrane protein